MVLSAFVYHFPEGAMTRTLQQKEQDLRLRLRQCDGLLVAFSGGLDSTLLAAVAHAELGERMLAVTALSPVYPEHEQREAAAWAAQTGIPYATVVSNELEVPGYAENPPNRCYLCKGELFTLLKTMAAERGLNAVADGTNADDAADYRPGRQAACELGIISPLLDAGLGKSDIRALSRALGLPTADKPAFACLASRFPYGSLITEDKLKAVGAVENVLRTLGFRQFRARHHGDTVRIEVAPDELPHLIDPAIRAQTLAAAHGAGFTYVAADLDGYRTGSLNAGLE